MKIKYGSDLHTEFGPFQILSQNDDKDSTLVLVGDQGRQFQYEEACDQFAHVIAVAGNHDYYGKSIEEVEQEFFGRLSQKCKNFHFLQCNELVLNEVRFLGCTLWSDLRNGNPLISHNVASRGEDFRKIVNSGRDDNLSLDEMLSMNREHQSWLRKKLEEPTPLKTAVLTHFAPDRICRDIRHAEDDFSYYMTNSNMRDVVELETWDVWLFGHVHSKQRHEFTTQDGRLQQLLSNPRGYPHREEVAHFTFETLEM